MGKDEAGHELSYHIFMFPFKWDYKACKKELDEVEFNRRVDINAFAVTLKDSDWHRNPFKISQMEVPDYNELIYFYDFVRDALFDFGEEKDVIYNHYEYMVSPDAKYKIHIKEKDRPYELKIDKILLDVYNTGVAILSYHLKNTRYRNLDDILFINDYGRRIYPQFLDEGDFTGKTRGAFLAGKIEVILDKKSRLEEDFTYFDNMEKIRGNPYKLSSTITGLLCENFVTWKDNAGVGDNFIEPVVDDRMFVLCWYADDKLCAKLAKYDNKDKSYNYIQNDDWYKFLFIDTKEPTCKSIKLKDELLKTHSYDRWLAEGEECALYGFCRYSFVVLTTKSSSCFGNNIKTIYFRMIKLALLQRASILRFSHEVTHISALKKTKDTTRRISSLHESYIRFINKVYFREVTAQEQGIELYDRIAQVMKIERDVKDLNREIDDLHQYASLIEDKRSNRQLHILTILGALFVIPAFIAGFFGMNIFSGKMEVTTPVKYRLIVCGLFLIPLLAALWLSLYDRWKEKSMSFLRRFVLIIIPIFIIIMLVILVLIPGAML